MNLKCYPTYLATFQLWTTIQDFAFASISCTEKARDYEHANHKAHSPSLLDWIFKWLWSEAIKDPCDRCNRSWANWSCGCWSSSSRWDSSPAGNGRQREKRRGNVKFVAVWTIYQECDALHWRAASCVKNCHTCSASQCNISIARNMFGEMKAMSGRELLQFRLMRRKLLKLMMRKTSILRVKSERLPHQVISWANSLTWVTYCNHLLLPVIEQSKAAFQSKDPATHLMQYSKMSAVDHSTDVQCSSSQWTTVVPLIISTILLSGINSNFFWMQSLAFRCSLVCFADAAHEGWSNNPWDV